ncbi:MAG: hypothetical protein H6Q90_6753 [Deltaproteobacteria bacterium]|nr:hypothetical protein [Deltaproteobacteria bacterium]
MGYAPFVGMAYAQPHHELIEELLFPGPGGREYPNDRRQMNLTFVGLAIAAVVIVAMIMASIL